MQSSKDLRHLMALKRVPGMGDHSIRKLIQRFGTPEAVFRVKNTHLAKVEGVGPLRLKAFDKKLHLDEADRELEFTEANDITVLSYFDSGYPDWLRHCYDAPLLLFCKGNIDLKAKKAVSIVGTRNITRGGEKFCKQFIREMSVIRPVIVSGFAYGVDICAHRTAIQEGLQTIACLAHGLDQYYPKVHERYAAKIMENGGFITEFWSTDVFDRRNFIRRNRIIAGLSEATVVIESAEKGGSLITADIAGSYNRDVFAVPGRVSDQFSKGCNDLIKSQRAQLLTSAADLIYHLGWDISQSTGTIQQKLFFPDLNGDEGKLIKHMEDGEKQHFDELLTATNWTPQKLASLLFDLEMKGLVTPIPGNYYCRC